MDWIKAHNASVLSSDVCSGGTFGPEGGVLAPMIYVLGIAAVYWIYGLDRWGEIAHGMPTLAAAMMTS